MYSTLLAFALLGRRVLSDRLLDISASTGRSSTSICCSCKARLSFRFFSLGCISVRPNSSPPICESSTGCSDISCVDASRAGVLLRRSACNHFLRFLLIPADVVFFGCVGASASLGTGSLLRKSLTSSLVYSLRHVLLQPSANRSKEASSVIISAYLAHCLITSLGSQTSAD